MPHALALSLVLHAVVLAGSPVVPVAGGMTLPLQASLRRPAEVPPPLPVAEPLPAATAATARPAAVPPAPTLARAAPASIAASDAPLPPMAEHAPSASGASREPVTPPVATSGSGQAIHAAAPPAAGMTGPDPDGLRSYRVALAREARRFKRYPREAQAAGWTGTAEVRLEVGDGGTARAPSLARSSGREALDGAALAMISAAAQATVVPAALRGKSFAVVLPVSFELDD